MFVAGCVPPCANNDYAAMAIGTPILTDQTAPGSTTSVSRRLKAGITLRAKEYDPSENPEP